MTGKRRRWRWWHVYLLLLAISNLVQLLWPGWPGEPPRADQATLTVPRMRHQGEVEGNPVTLTYRAYGDPNASIKLLALHGSPKFGPDFSVLGPKLGERAHVVSIDMPGFGGSSKRVPDYGIEAQARYALAAMDQLGWDRAHVLGYSLGSGAALEMFDAQPQRVESLVFYGGVGIMEGEGSGDYRFEQLKYRVGYGLVVVGFELLPHGGLLGRRSLRHAFLRSFMDTDQRPLRGVLEKVDAAKLPMLIVHDHDDVLVPAGTAREHHDIVAHSQLVMLAHGHVGLFQEAGAREIADAVGPFLERAAQPGYVPTRRTDDPYLAQVVEAESPLPFGWDLKRGMSPWEQMGVVIACSYVLEDPTTVFTGMMIKDGQIDLFVGLFAIFVGIFTGDLALYAIGFTFGRRALRWKPLAKRLPVRRVENLGAWFDRHGWTAVLASRFIPGTRFPLYVSAGALGNKPVRFALWTCIAVAIWAVVMLMIVIGISKVVLEPIRGLFGERTVLALIAAIVLLVIAMRVLAELTTTVGRGRLKAAVSRVWRHEFWSPWVFYAPLVPWVAYLTLRYGRFETLTAVNPAMPHSGFVGESKHEILASLPEAWVVPSALIDTGALDARLERLEGVMAERGWSWPLVLKPNEGQRGFAVRKIDDRAEAREYLEAVPLPVLAQTYHPGPHEVGIFYYRLPDEPAGHIYSICAKRFPRLTGDGRHTVEQLIYRDRRLRMQADVFLRRLGDERDRVPAEGETIDIAVAGNHAQGTMFCDGGHLVTEALAQRIDAIARSYDGFYFGRFDVRYADEEELKAGRGFRILELNGVMSESTNLYDPKRSLAWAYGLLFEQWRIAFRIGSANRKRGVAVTPLLKLLGAIRAHYRRRTFEMVAD